MSELEDARVGVVTGEQKPELTPGGRDFIDEIERRGGDARPVVWSADEQWTAFDVLVLRSCWNYDERVAAFRDWLADVERAGAAVLNPPDVVRWNVHKSYLLDLRDAGVPVLATELVPEGSSRALAAVLRERGWSDAVVKPAVATSSTGAFRVSRDPGQESEDRFAAAVADGDVLVQRFAPEIRDGERSMVFLGGSFNHALRRVPASDDFRAHPAYGGTVTCYEPAASTVDQAADALDAARDVIDVPASRVPYARVDGVLRDGTFRLMELELVEPYLALRDADGAVVRLADAVEDALLFRR